MKRPESSTAPTAPKTPVIRQMVVAEEDNRLMNRQVPAAVLSGLIQLRA